MGAGFLLKRRELRYILNWELWNSSSLNITGAIRVCELVGVWNTAFRMFHGKSGHALRLASREMPVSFMDTNSAPFFDGTRILHSLPMGRRSLSSKAEEFRESR